MKKKLFIALLLLQNVPFFAQNIEANSDEIKQAQIELALPFAEYMTNGSIYK